MNKPISCELFDYIEIACMFGYRLKLSLSNGETLVGKALTTRTTTDKIEQLLIQNLHDNKQLAVDTRTISALEVLTPNARFKHVNFD